MSSVTCHMSGVTCHMSGFSYHKSHLFFLIKFNIYNFSLNVVKLFGGGSVINGDTPSSFKGNCMKLPGFPLKSVFEINLIDY